MPIIHILQMPTSESKFQKIEVWCNNKKCEYCYVAMSVSISTIITRSYKSYPTDTSEQGTVVASAVTASFSWNGFDVNASWFTLGTWYGSIIFSLVSVIVAFHYIILFTNFNIDPEGPRKVLRAISSDGVRPDFVFLYVLQVPEMLLSFSLISYFMGLSLLVTPPLWEEEWGTGMKVSFFLEARKFYLAH